MIEEAVYALSYNGLKFRLELSGSLRPKALSDTVFARKKRKERRKEKKRLRQWSNGQRERYLDINSSTQSPRSLCQLSFFLHDLARSHLGTPLFCKGSAVLGPKKGILEIFLKDAQTFLLVHVLLGRQLRLVLRLSYWRNFFSPDALWCQCLISCASVGGFVAVAISSCGRNTLWTSRLFESRSMIRSLARITALFIAVTPNCLPMSDQLSRNLITAQLLQYRDSRSKIHGCSHIDESPSIASKASISLSPSHLSNASTS